jgi:hypothetical protein
MAITPRTLFKHPVVLLLAILCSASVVSGMAFLFLEDEHDNACRDAVGGDVDHWMHHQWFAYGTCLLVDQEYETARRASDDAIERFPRSEGLVNVGAYAALELRDFEDAGVRLRRGMAQTGSPSGVLENNLAWTLLWTVDDHPTIGSKLQVLHRARSLYQGSLRKGQGCERIHTGLVVEFGLAHVYSEGGDRAKTVGVRDAVRRYSSLWGRYQGCVARVGIGDKDVVEEVVSAMVIDQEMGLIAGVQKPCRQLASLKTALQAGRRSGQLADDVCSQSLPLAAAHPACEALVWAP